MLILGNIKRRKIKNMEKKYNIIICPEYDVPLDKLKESGVEFCKKELSDSEQLVFRCTCLMLI